MAFKDDYLITQDDLNNYGIFNNYDARVATIHFDGGSLLIDQDEFIPVQDMKKLINAVNKKYMQGLAGESITDL